MNGANGVFVGQPLFALALDLRVLRVQSISQRKKGVPFAQRVTPCGTARLDVVFGVSYCLFLPVGGAVQLAQEGTVVLVVEHAQPASKAFLHPFRIVVTVLLKKCELISGGIGETNSVAQGSHRIICPSLRQLNQSQ
jgi:hypothetical protein